jgi:hypothetical protein
MVMVAMGLMTTGCGVVWLAAGVGNGAGCIGAFGVGAGGGASSYTNCAPPLWKCSPSIAKKNLTVPLVWKYSNGGLVQLKHELFSTIAGTICAPNLQDNSFELNSLVAASELT